MISKSMHGMGPAIPHLADKPGGLAGEIWDLRNDVDQACRRLETPGLGTGVVAVEEWLAPPQTVTDHFLAATAFDVAAQSVPATGAALGYARNVIIDVVIATGAGVGDVVVTGKDAEGADRAVTIAVPAATGQVDGLVPLVSIATVDIPEAAAFTGTVAVGFGDKLGLDSPIKTRSYGAHVIQELEDGGAPAGPGQFVDATTAPPFGTYRPDNVPDGVINYVLTYERDNS